MSKILNELEKVIINITRFLIEKNIIIDQKFPSKETKKNFKISWEQSKDLSYVLKDQEYHILYREIVKNRDYNFMFLDGGIIQLMYKSDKNSIIEHRLAFFPNPFYEQFAENIEFEETVYQSKNLSVEILDVNTIYVPVRFDFSIDEKRYEEIKHPYSHLTLGNYKDCRIPVSSIITPKLFIEFILRNFYYIKFKDIFNDWENLNDLKIYNSNLLSNKEKRVLHLNYELS